MALIPEPRFMGAALALAERGRGQSAPNPNVGCVIVNHHRVVGRGWTQRGGRPHAEAMALAEAGGSARGATVYVTLEPCAHVSPRGPACSDLLAEAGVAQVVIALRDPDPRTSGKGVERLRAQGIDVRVGDAEAAARRSLEGFLTRQSRGRPHVTLKLATSLDGCIARADGESKWITGAAARAHAHVERARHEAIVVGRGTFESDQPELDVRLPGLSHRAPRRFVLTTRPLPSPTTAHQSENWTALHGPTEINDWVGIDHLLVEGGARTATAFLAAGLVDRLLLYRAPILIGGGKPALGDVGLDTITDAHGRWELRDTRMLGIDRLEIYESTR